MPTKHVFGGDRSRVYLVILFFSVLFTVVSLPWHISFLYDDFSVGHKAEKNLIAIRDYSFFDRLGFEKKKERLRKSFPVVVDVDSVVMDRELDQLREGFQRMRKWAQSFPYERYQNDQSVAAEGVSAFRQSFQTDAIGQESFLALWAGGFSEKMEEIAEGAGTVALQKGYMSAQSMPGGSRRIVKRILPDFEETEVEENIFIAGSDHLRRFITDWALRTYPDTPHKLLRAGADLMALYLRPNVFVNLGETERRESEAAGKLTPSYLFVKKGEIVAVRGDVILNSTHEKIAAMMEEESERAGIKRCVLKFIMYAMLGMILFTVASASVKKFRADPKSVLFANFVIFLTGISVVVFQSAGVQMSFAYAHYPLLMVYVVPFALSGMLLRLFLNSETAIITLLLMLILIGDIVPYDYFLMIFAFASALTGIYFMGHFYTRGQILLSGLKVAVINAVLIGVVMLLIPEKENLFAGRKILMTAGVFLSGFGSSVLLIVLTPAFEYIFRFTTNVRLLELSNLDNPLLKELMVKAPGTYNHSILIGNLVEAAARAIRVNPLLARVSAYYHDIGKIKMPDFFIENQVSGYNRHEELSPYMSVLVVMSHVKEGVEFARQHNLGKPIVDAIVQHHGTRLVTFFYAKALKEDPSAKEEMFRYAGPKPRSRETGLIMMADAVEAACRVLDDPTPARINGLVQKIIQEIFLDGQLEECDLTLRDLNLVIDSFSRTLLGIYHQRIDYPEIPSGRENGHHK